MFYAYQVSTPALFAVMKTASFFLLLPESQPIRTSFLLFAKPLQPLTLSSRA